MYLIRRYYSKLLLFLQILLHWWHLLELKDCQHHQRIQLIDLEDYWKYFHCNRPCSPWRILFRCVLLKDWLWKRLFLKMIHYGIWLSISTILQFSRRDNYFFTCCCGWTLLSLWRNKNFGLDNMLLIARYTNYGNNSTIDIFIAF